MNTDIPYQNQRSHLFTLRMWQEETEINQSEWRGKIQLMVNRDVRYFRGLDTLIPLLTSMLSEFNTLSEPNTSEDIDDSL